MGNEEWAVKCGWVFVDNLGIVQLWSPKFMIRGPKLCDTFQACLWKVGEGSIQTHPSLHYWTSYLINSKVENIKLNSKIIPVLDSWLKFSSKPLISSLINFGPFTDCLNFHINLNSSEIQGQHCLVSYSSILSHNFDETSIEYEIDSIIEKETFVLKNGICVPSSCSMSEIENFLRNHLKETDIVVLNTYCQTKEMFSLNVLDIFVLWEVIELWWKFHFIF